MINAALLGMVSGVMFAGSDPLIRACVCLREGVQGGMLLKGPWIKAK